MPIKDSDQQRPGTWGSNKFIIVLAIVVLAAVAGTVVSQRGTNPADAPQHQQAEKAAPAAAEPASTQEVQTPSGSSKDQPSDAPKP